MKYTLTPQVAYSRKVNKWQKKFNPRKDKILIDVGAFGEDANSIVFAKSKQAKHTVNH